MHSGFRTEYGASTRDLCALNWRVLKWPAEHRTPRCSVGLKYIDSHLSGEIRIDGIKI